MSLALSSGGFTAPKRGPKKPSSAMSAIQNFIMRDIP
jgi:hypothetical protein